MKKEIVKLRLSPNEEARLIREEHERRRKLRIQQVREQQRLVATHIRQAVEKRRQRELEQLGEELRLDWERQQREKVDQLQRLYQESLQLLGQGHRSAKEKEPDLAAIAQREEANHAKAEQRYREALKELKSQRLKDHERQSQSINAKKKALQTEKERSAKVASLPPPLPNPIQNIDFKKPHVVRKSDVGAFATTHYHMQESTVDREIDTEQPNAHDEAELEVMRLQDLQREERSRRVEQLEKARLRGRQALRREQLTQDRELLLVELKHMQQTDFLRRRQQVSQVPPQIFQPLYKRQETTEEFQREMEFAFEDMYTSERRVKGDLVVQLEPEPLPALSTGSKDQELDVTLDEISTADTQCTPGDAEQDAANTQQVISAPEEPSKPAPRLALKKLLERIRNQRIDPSCCVPAASSQTVITDQIPERDSTIETGSIISNEKLRERAHLPPASQAAEQSTPEEDPRLPDTFANRIQECEDERKRREEELEQEKQQQLVLLQELEEQKTKLEQMLLEAQQEREYLKAAVCQEEPLNQPDTPNQDGGITASLNTVVDPPAGEDDHTWRIREYQQRLLEQNRVHQRSVEVARQRLEEYQRALQIRYNRTATTRLPTVMPPGLSHLPLRITQSVKPPTPLVSPAAPAVLSYIHNKAQNSMDVPTTEPGTLVSGLQLTGYSLSSGFKQLPNDKDEFRAMRPTSQRPDMTSWLTDSIMERATVHLPESVRLGSPIAEPQPHKLLSTHHSPTSPQQSLPDPTSAIITNGASLPSVIRSATSPLGSLQTGSLGSRIDDMEKQRRELQEVQRRLLERQQEERERREEQQLRREVELEQMRQQKEILQALIHTDAQSQPGPEATTDVSASENIGQTRLQLLVSLLRALEESHGGTLSHLEDPQENIDSSLRESDPTTVSSVRAVGPAPASVLPPGLFLPTRPAKPPVTRVRLGNMEVMTEQHELSAIQEVETPFSSSQVTGLENGMKVPSHTITWDLQKELDLSGAPNRTLKMSSMSSSVKQLTAERPTSPGTGSGILNHLIWRERLLSGAGSSPELSESESILKIMSPLPSDSGQGADYSGPAFTSYRSTTESPHRRPHSDCLSTTTISTGSYITTDPEENVNMGKPPPVRPCEEHGQEADVLDVSSPSTHSSFIQDTPAAGRPAVSVESLFNDSSIQRIIDRYTRELNISLSTAGTTTDGERSSVEDPGSSLSQPAMVQSSEKTAEDDGSAGHPLLSDTAGTQTQSVQETDITVDPVLEHFSYEAPSQTEDSFRPLIGQLADQSSCLAIDSAMEQLVGQPSTHSSMIGQPPGPEFSVSLDQSGWESTLSRMISRLSRQSSCDWAGGVRDFSLGQQIGLMVSEQSTVWLDDSQEENRMRPLVGELDNDQHSGVSGGCIHMNPSVSSEDSLPLYPPLPPEASSHSVEVQDQEHSRSMGAGQEREDSFRPLVGEVTHNETVDPSMTFHLLEHNMPNSPEGQASDESEAQPDPGAESDLSPESLRADMSTSHDSSQSRPHGSVLVLEETRRADVETTALSLSSLTTSDDTPAVGGAAARSCSVVCIEDMSSEQGSSWIEDNPVSGMVSEKGILEQSEITLLSLTDTVPHTDQETSLTEEDGIWEDDSDGKGQKSCETQVTESTLVPEEILKEKDQTHPVVFLEVQWGPSSVGSKQEVNQQKRQALLQRSSRRLENNRAKRAFDRNQPQIPAPPEAREQCNATYQSKTKSELRQKSNMSIKGQAEKSGLITQRKAQLSPPVNDSRVKEMDEVKIHTPGQRKEDVSEMYQRTQRLYEQLEEVKQQKTIRNRQEAYARNRLKAKEFHKKTLQKLRAKQTQQ